MTRKEHSTRPVEFDCCGRQGTIAGMSIMPIIPAQAPHHHEFALRKLQTPIVNSEKFQAVIDRNNECAWVFHQLRPDDYSRVSYFGFTVFLPLTKSGREGLLAGSIDMTDPPSRAIAGRDEVPVCLYWWITAVDSSVFKIVPLIVNELLGPRYRHLDIIARIGSRAGGASMARVGFEPLESSRDGIGDLIVYRRLANRTLDPCLVEGRWSPEARVHRPMGFTAGRERAA